MRTTLWETRCEKGVMWKKLWKISCDKMVLRKTMWERRCEKDKKKSPSIFDLFCCCRSFVLFKIWILYSYVFLDWPSCLVVLLKSTGIQSHWPSSFRVSVRFLWGPDLACTSLRYDPNRMVLFILNRSSRRVITRSRKWPKACVEWGWLNAGYFEIL